MRFRNQYRYRTRSNTGFKFWGLGEINDLPRNQLIIKSIIMIVKDEDNLGANYVATSQDGGVHCYLCCFLLLLLLLPECQHNQCNCYQLKCNELANNDLNLLLPPPNHDSVGIVMKLNSNVPTSLVCCASLCLLRVQSAGIYFTT